MTPEPILAAIFTTRRRLLSAPACFTDWNNDGFIDLLVGDDNGTVRLLINKPLGKEPLYVDGGFIKNGRVNLDVGGRASPAVIDLNRDGKNWRVDGMKSSQSADSTRVDQILKALDDLSIVDVRPKPAGLSASLKADTKDQQLSREDLLSLRSRGFFVNRDGQLLSNEGEIRVRTTDGIRYTLRFGEVASGTDEAADPEARAGENRYLFVTTDFDRQLFPEPPRPANNDFAGKADSLLTDADRDNRAKQNAYNVWTGKINSGQTLNSRLNQRFADWYYVISGESFTQLRVKRSDLLTAR